MIVVDTPADLGRDQLVAVADGVPLTLTEGLLGEAAGWRAAVVDALTGPAPVYGVSTGMGSLSHLAVGTADQPAYQDDLMLARSVGTAPWLSRRATRAALAARLRTLLAPEVGVSPGLLRALVALLAADALPAIPATGNGAAGEIIPLAHLGGFLTGSGQGLDSSGTAAPADRLLAAAGLAPYECGAKEGVALLQGLPVATGDAALVAADLRRLAAQSLTVASATIAAVRAPRDPYDGQLARGDDVLAEVLASIRGLTGDEPAPRLLQAPVSFRLLGGALAHLLRTTARLEEAVDRALDGVSTSPALLDGRFLGTAGFDGFEVAACADACRTAALHLAEVSAARLHRLLDPRVSGLPAQLSADPGRQAGVVALHKRAVGLLHAARRGSAPAALGSMETSLGQEDVQSFALEATGAAHAAVDVVSDVVACELVALHQAHLLDPALSRGTEALQMVLHKAFGALPQISSDRVLGREVTAVRHMFSVGWGYEPASAPDETASQSPGTLT